MYRFFKNLNTFGLAIIMVAGTVIFTQSAFKSGFRLNKYYYDQEDHKWYPLTRTFDDTPVDEAYDPNSYQCNYGPDAYCTGEFSETATELPGIAIPRGTGVRGIYTPNN